MEYQVDRKKSYMDEKTYEMIAKETEELVINENTILRQEIAVLGYLVDKALIYGLVWSVC